MDTLRRAQPSSSNLACSMEKSPPTVPLPAYGRWCRRVYFGEEKHGASGAQERAHGTDTLLLHEQHQERARCARNRQSCRWVQGGITPKTSLFLQHKGGDRVSGKGKSYLFFPPGEASCIHTAACLGLPAAAALLARFSAPLLLPLGGWDSLLSSLRVEHH